jgi:predicted metal-dependent HD superfamily phosphohydrolase
MNNLLQEIKEYVVVLLTDKLSEELTFHNLGHTFEVVEALQKIIGQTALSEEDSLIVQTAAWFHDCGYAICYKGHEEESKRIAKEFLENYGCEKVFIEKVLQCIESTKFPQHPVSDIEKIICDADMFHLTKTNYYQYEKALRLEFEKYLGLIFTDEEWKIKNNDFLRNHQYFTEYGQNILTKFKEVNVRLVNHSNNF